MKIYILNNTLVCAPLGNFGDSNVFAIIEDLN